MLTETELAGLVAEAMGSGAAVRLVQNSPDGRRNTSPRRGLSTAV